MTDSGSQSSPLPDSACQLRVGIIDYGMGNVRSVLSAISLFGHSAIVSSDSDELARCDRLILPGVGSFRRAVENIHARGLDIAIPKLVRSGCPLLGICLGMQLLATIGTEDGESAGLGLIEGKVSRIPSSDLPVPHVGFNTVRFREGASPFNNQLGQEADFYFVHSFHFEVRNPSSAVGYVNYGSELVAAVRQGHVLGTQFHPEKSQSNGLKFLQAFFHEDSFTNT